MPRLHQQKGLTDKAGILAKIVFPVVIGIAIIVWLFHDEFNSDTISLIRFDKHLIIALLFGLFCIVGRDWGMCWRFRILTNRELSWRQTIKVTMLCEFTSAITPSSVGGGALGMIFLNREGINMGRATTLTLTTLLLDELFFVISCPIIIALLPGQELFGFGDEEFTHWLKIAFWVIYAAIFIWTAILYIAILIKPHVFHRLLTHISRYKFLKRWQHKFVNTADNMVTASIDLKRQGIKWFAKAFTATIVSWLSRYLLVNALFWGFYPDASQLTIFARQFIVWAILMVSPTPGGSGVSEYIFSKYYGDLITGSGIVLILAMFWRIMSYYIYLLIGIFFLPSFLSATKKDNYSVNQLK